MKSAKNSLHHRALKSNTAFQAVASHLSWQTGILILGLICATLLSGEMFPLLAQTSGDTAIDCYTQIDPIYKQTDVRSLITIHNEAELNAKREALIKFLWDGDGFPATKLPLPDDIKPGVAPPLSDLPNLKSVDQITVRLQTIKSLADQPKPVSIIYFLHPLISSGRLAVFHQGHEDWATPLFWNGGQETISTLLAQGYDVLAMQMPICGENLVAPFQNCVDAHQSIGDIQNPDFNFLKLFVEPVAVALNYATQNTTYQQILMTGISGGGWTTVLYAALDPRVQISLPVAGSLPYYLRTGQCGDRDLGDWEQIALNKFIDYTDLYVMGAYGQGRVQIQAFNQYDDCCFSGIRYQTYEPVVRDALGSIGPGSFSVFLDTVNNHHLISAATLADFVESMNATFPNLLTIAGTREAIALDAETLQRGPFSVTSVNNLGDDKRRRLLVVASHLPADVGASSHVIEISAESNELKFYPLPIEYVGRLAASQGLTQFIIRLPDELDHAGQVWLSIKVDGKTSVSSFIQIN